MSRGRPRAAAVWSKAAGGGGVVEGGLGRWRCGRRRQGDGGDGAVGGEGEVEGKDLAKF